MGRTLRLFLRLCLTVGLGKAHIHLLLDCLIVAKSVFIPGNRLIPMFSNIDLSKSVP